VNSAKFAAITASLLARKGDAAPSVIASVAAPPRPTLVPRDDRPLPSEPRQLDKADKLRRIVVSITQEELERLCIAAIKKGTNRHDIVRGALDDYFRKLSAELPHPCACMEGRPAVRAPRHADIANLPGEELDEFGIHESFTRASAPTQGLRKCVDTASSTNSPLPSV
jgi:hypothetical protein